MPYDQYQVASAPPFLQRDVGERWLSCFGLLKDAAVEGAIQAVKARFIQTCPNDAVAIIGAERSLDQLVTERLPDYRARIQNAWSAWAQAGTRAGILAQIGLLGFSNVTIKENADWAAGVVNPATDWARWWLIIDQPHPFTIVWAWGDSTVWGDPLKSWGMKPYALFLSLLKILRTWRPAHAQLQSITFIISGRLWAGGWAWADGTTWGAQTVAIQVP